MLTDYRSFSCAVVLRRSALPGWFDCWSCSKQLAQFAEQAASIAFADHCVNPLRQFPADNFSADHQDHTDTWLDHLELLGDRPAFRDDEVLLVQDNSVDLVADADGHRVVRCETQKDTITSRAKSFVRMAPTAVGQQQHSACLDHLAGTPEVRAGRTS